MRLSIKELLTLSICFALSCSALITLRAVLPLPAASGLVDMRTDKTKNDHFIVLNMRDAGGYGHALMTWIAQEGDSRNTVSFGYYADQVGNVLEVFDTSGQLLDETSVPIDQKRETRLALVFWVSGDQYQAVLSRADRWRGKGQYQLFRRDCVAFVADMVEPLGLKIPSRLFQPGPYDFVVALLEANAQRPDL